VGLAIFIGIWVLIIHELINAPEIDDNANIIKKDEIKKK